MSARSATINKGLICRKPVKTAAEVKGLKDPRGRRHDAAYRRRWAACRWSWARPMPPRRWTRGTIDCVHGVTTWLQEFRLLGRGQVRSRDAARQPAHHQLGGLRPPRLGQDDAGRQEGRHRRRADAPRPHGLSRQRRRPTSASRKRRSRSITSPSSRAARTSRTSWRSSGTRSAPRFREVDAEKLGVDERQGDFRRLPEESRQVGEARRRRTTCKNDMNAMAAAYKKEIYDKLDPSKL